MIQGEKEAYLRELQGVAAMMAYGELTAAPESVRKYLDLGRREGLADLVIAGILRASFLHHLSLCRVTDDVERKQIMKDVRRVR